MRCIDGLGQGSVRRRSRLRRLRGCDRREGKVWLALAEGMAQGAILPPLQACANGIDCWNDSEVLNTVLQHVLNVLVSLLCPLLVQESSQ